MQIDTNPHFKYKCDTSHITNIFHCILFIGRFLDDCRIISPLVQPPCLSVPTMRRVDRFDSLAGNKGKVSGMDDTVESTREGESTRSEPAAIDTAIRAGHQS